MDPGPYAGQVGRLAYLYVGVDAVDAALEFYQDALGAEFLWRFAAFDTEVAAVSMGPGPQVMLAAHRPVPSVLPIWVVDDFDGALARLAVAGGAASGVTAATPDGPVHVVRDPAGNELGLLRADRPGALEAAYSDPGNDRAVRD